MKNLFITLILAISSNLTFAQSHIGIKFGSPTVSSKTTSKDLLSNETGEFYKLNYLSTKTSYSYGLALYNDIGENWWLSADILFRKKEVNFNVIDNPFTRSSNPYSDKFSELVVPVAAGFRKNNFKIGVGPTFSYKAKSEISLTSMDGFSIDERKLNTGFQFLVGYIIKDRIHIDLKKELNFNGTGDDYFFNHKQLKLKSLPHTFSFSAAIYL